MGAKARIMAAQKLSGTMAFALNFMNMFGTGPFITIPLVIAASSPAGPQHLFGYGAAAVLCILDSLVWSELGSMVRPQIAVRSLRCVFSADSACGRELCISEARFWPRQVTRAVEEVEV